MHIEERLLMAMRKRVAPTLRRVVDGDPTTFELHRLQWNEINKRQQEILNAARAQLDKIEASTGGDRDDLERCHDGLMAVWDEFEFEKDQRTALGSREPRAQGGSARRPLQDATSIPDGQVADGSDGNALARHALAPDERMAQRVSDRPGAATYRNLSEGAYLRSLVLGAQSDLERRALSEGTDSAGGYTVPEIVSARLIDRMRANMVVMKAGARTVPLTSDTAHYARVASDPVPAWRAEAGTVAESGPTFDRVTFTPRSLAVLVKVSRELLEDSLNIGEALPRVLAAAMAAEVDRVALFGSGSSPEPRGIVNTSGIGAIALNAQLASGNSYLQLMKARTAILTANAPEPTAFIMNPREDGTLAGLVDGQGQPLMVPPKIASVPFLTTSAVPINGGVGTNEGSIIAGYFPDLVIGMRSEIRIEVLKERFADNLQYGFLAHLRVDVAVEHAESFVKITGIKP